MQHVRIFRRPHVVVQNCLRDWDRIFRSIWSYTDENSDPDAILSWMDDKSCGVSCGSFGLCNIAARTFSIISGDRAPSWFTVTVNLKELTQFLIVRTEVRYERWSTLCHIKKHFCSLEGKESISYLFWMTHIQIRWPKTSRKTSRHRDLKLSVHWT